ncbi:MAG: rhodanese-like domain-containing protein [Candidatus Thiodiazotropha lotti]|nr:rhodanese-like domain-containing protein [Candidatus Thiodiazotropha lotti]
MKSVAKTTLVSLCLLFSGSAFAVDLPVKTDKSYVSPATVTGATTVDSAKAHELWKARAWFIDPRKPEQYEAGRIPGALNIEYDPGTPNQQLTADSLAAEVPKDEAVVFYCNAEGCDRSSWGAALAVEWGWSKVYYFRDGFPGWTTAGYPVE